MPGDPSRQALSTGIFMNSFCIFAAAGTVSSKPEIIYILEEATPEAKAIILFLVFFSIAAWSVMFSKVKQMGRALGALVLWLVRGDGPVQEIGIEVLPA